MVIENFNKVYTVVQQNSAELHKDVYICRNQEDNQLYTIIRIKDKRMIKKIIEFICEQKNNTKFSDFIETFACKEEFYSVFTYSRGMSLEKRLKQICSLEERMEIGKRLLERMVLYELPFYFQCQCLKMENIIVTDALEVRFQYTLDKVEDYDSCTNQTASAYLYLALKSLFVKELKNNVIDPMKEFLKDVQRNEKMNYLEIYQAYCSVCEEIKKIPKEEMQTPKHMLFRFWEKVKNCRKVIKGAMMTFIFIGVLIYMLYSIYMSLQVKGYEKHFETIGTVQIENDGLEEETE